MVRLASAVLLAGAAGLSAGFSPAAGQSARVATTRRHLFFGSPFQWLIGGDEPTPKMVRRKARPNRRHPDRPVGEAGRAFAGGVVGGVGSVVGGVAHAGQDVVGGVRAGVRSTSTTLFD